MSRTRSSPERNRLRNLALLVSTGSGPTVEQERQLSSLPKQTLYQRLKKNFGWRRLTRRERRHNLARKERSDKFAEFSGGGGSGARSPSSSDSARSPGRQKRKWRKSTARQVLESSRRVSSRSSRSSSPNPSAVSEAAPTSPQRGSSKFISSGRSRDKAVAKAAAANVAAAEKEERDPITLAPLGEYRFQVRRLDGNMTGATFNTASLVGYMLNTGNFCDPTTRTPFSDAELARLDRAARAARLPLDRYPSVLASRKDAAFSKKTELAKFRRDAVLGLDRCLGEVAVDMVTLVENCADAEMGEVRLITQLFPHYSDLLNQIAEEDHDFARQCAQHYLSFVEGPPNRPTPDSVGLLAPVLRFLRDAAKAGRPRSDSLQGFSSTTVSGDGRNGGGEVDGSSGSNATSTTTSTSIRASTSASRLASRVASSSDSGGTDGDDMVISEIDFSTTTPPPPAPLRLRRAS